MIEAVSGCVDQMKARSGEASEASETGDKHQDPNSGMDLAACDGNRQQWTATETFTAW